MDEFVSHGEVEILLNMEDEDLRAAIATNVEASTLQNDYQSSNKQVATTEHTL